ncbi:MAG: hypothetical protein IKK07_10125 [Bacteroides sp.]|nr:hypothetical protein [Bacteroides sp.]
MRNLLLIIFSILLLAACTNSALRIQHSQLAKADSLMHTHPDSALALLQSISADSLTDEANRAYHALLLSQALDKNYIDKTDDSLINIAVDYYADKTVTPQQMLAHYYHARIKQNAKAYPEALYSALHAEAAALQLNDHYHLGLIYRLIMECYKRGYNEKKALEYAQLSYEHFALTEYKRYTNFALLNLADAYTANRNINQSIGIISPLIEVAEADKDTSLLSNALSSYSNTLMLQKKYALAKTSLLRLQMIKERPLTTRNYSHLAICYLYENQPDSALYYGVKAEKMIKNDADRYLYEKLQYLYHRREKDFETALAAYRKASSHHDDAMSSADNHEIDHVVQQFHEEQLKIAQKRTMKHYTYVVLVIFFVIIGVFILFAWREFRKHKHLKREAKTYIQLHSDLQKIIEDMTRQQQNDKETANRMQLAKLYKENMPLFLSLWKNIIIQLHTLINKKHSLNPYKNNWMN